MIETIKSIRVENFLKENKNIFKLFCKSLKILKFGTRKRCCYSITVKIRNFIEFFLIEKNGGKVAKIIDAYLEGRNGKSLSYDPNSKMYNVEIVDSENNKTMEQQINEKLVQFNDKVINFLKH